MSHGFVTVAIAFDADAASAVNQELAKHNRAARQAFDAVSDDAMVVHFMSIIVVEIEGEARSHLVLEASVDGGASAGLARIANTIGKHLNAILQTAEVQIPPGQTLESFLEAHRLKVGDGWFRPAGALYSGVPGMSVGRIRAEDRLAARLAEILESETTPLTALQYLARARAKIFMDPELKQAFIVQPAPMLAGPMKHFILRIISSAVREFLWPLLIPPAIAAILVSIPFSPIWGFVAAVLVLIGEVVLVGLVSLIILGKLRLDEKRSMPKDTEPHAETVGNIMRRENYIMQNHLTGVSTIKHGRRFILRFALWLVRITATFIGRPSFLTGIGSIHFARWLVLPGTNRLLFFSNYDGSWMSYLEDFIVRAHEGLSAIWSNTVDFPKTRLLTQGGASDGTRFKRWARRQQQPTPFWYSAYPTLTMDHIRLNAQIRYGFGSITDEVGAAKWLERFGIFARSEPVQSSEVPTLAFGGLSGLRHAHCFVVQLDGKDHKAARWLKSVEQLIHYGDRDSYRKQSMVVGFSAEGLSKFGLDSEELATFPTVFQHGMTEVGRSRALGDLNALGDEHKSAPKHWWWGHDRKSRDAVLLLYATDDHTLNKLEEECRREIAKFSHTISYDLRLTPLPEKGEVLREPFGFIDGISQPVIRGTRNAAAANEMHTLEPGEMVLGYVNNLGFVAPTPQCKGFDVGRNGTYLVVRQLEQNVTAFEDYLKTEAKAASPAKCPHSGNLAKGMDWIASKMVGRWRSDGTSLVQYPSGPPDNGTEPDNEFLFGKQDPKGLACPFGSHVRRANPRDSFEPGSATTLSITNRHRILRVGRSYKEGNDSRYKNREHPGLMFMCVNADIETQFEFLQQTWLLGSAFHGLRDETDPMIGNKPMTIPTASGPLRLNQKNTGLADFVTVRGGGYFFMPSREAVSFLTRDRPGMYSGI